MPSDRPTSVRVLIADDDIHNRRLLRDVCGVEGYMADLVEDGHQVLQRLAAQPYDLLLLDASMPGMSGFEVLEVLQHSPEGCCQPPVIMITANPHEAARQRAEQLGVAAFVEKPFRVFDLTQRIRFVLRCNSTIDSSRPAAVRAQIALCDVLPRLPAPKNLRPALRRALQRAAARQERVACIVLRFENAADMLVAVGQTARDAILGTLALQAAKRAKSLVYRSDEEEFFWVAPVEQAMDLGSFLQALVHAGCRALAGPDVPLLPEGEVSSLFAAPIELRAGAVLIDVGQGQCDPDVVLRAAKTLATVARKRKLSFVVEELSLNDAWSPDRVSSAPMESPSPEHGVSYSSGAPKSQSTFKDRP